MGIASHVLSFMASHSLVARMARSEAGVVLGVVDVDGVDVVPSVVSSCPLPLPLPLPAPLPAVSSRRFLSSATRFAIAGFSYVQVISLAGGACVSVTVSSADIRNACSVRMASIPRSSLDGNFNVLCAWWALKLPRNSLCWNGNPNLRNARPWKESAFVFFGNVRFACDC